MVGVLWGSCAVWHPQQLCRTRAQPALGYRNNDKHGVTVSLRALSPEVSFSCPPLFLLSAASATVTLGDLCATLGSGIDQSLPLSLQLSPPLAPVKVCSFYPMIQPITPLTSSESGFSCLVLFFLPRLFPSVTLIPSELNHLSQSKLLILPQISYKLFPTCFAPTPSVLGWAVFSHSCLIQCHI